MSVATDTQEYWAKRYARELKEKYGSADAAAQHIVSRLGQDRVPNSERDELALAGGEIFPHSQRVEHNLRQALTDERIRRGDSGRTT